MIELYPANVALNLDGSWTDITNNLPPGTNVVVVNYNRNIAQLSFSLHPPKEYHPDNELLGGGNKMGTIHTSVWMKVPDGGPIHIGKID